MRSERNQPRLSAARQASAVTLAEEVTAELTLLAMPHARLTIAVVQHPVDAGVLAAVEQVRA